MFLRLTLSSIMGLSLSGCLAAAAFVGADEMAKGSMGKAERRSMTIEALGNDGKDLIPRYIEIEDVQKEDGQESWRAETPKGDYRCIAKTGISKATCTKI